MCKAQGEDCKVDLWLSSAIYLNSVRILTPELISEQVITKTI